MDHHFARYLGMAASTTAATLMLTACGGEALSTGYINKTGTSANINVSSGNAPGVNISMP